MSEFKVSHTPGKWQYHSGSVWTKDGNLPIAKMERDPDLAHGIPPTERDANARLIALVPEMLEICKGIVLYEELKNWHVYDMAVELLNKIEEGNE